MLLNGTSPRALTLSFKIIAGSPNTENYSHRNGKCNKSTRMRTGSPTCTKAEVAMADDWATKEKQGPPPLSLGLLGHRMIGSIVDV